MGILELIQQKAFLGREFLTWLWFRAEGDPVFVGERASAAIQNSADGCTRQPDSTLSFESIAQQHVSVDPCTVQVDWRSGLGPGKVERVVESELSCGHAGELGVGDRDP